ncbi:MAG: ABC transporter permease subunit, partial [Candidatus Bathyarchaeia archaeon]
MNITNAVRILTSKRTVTLLSNTLTFAVGGATLATALATIYAWIVVRTDVPGKRVLQLLPILPLVMPFVVKAFSWSLLFSPDLGLVNVLSKQYFGFSFFNIYSMEGLIFALGVGGIPLAYLAIKPAIEALNPALEEASRVCGNGILKTFLKVTIPILMPAILSAFMLLVIIGLENFDYPFMLGTKGGIKIETLATEIYFLIYGSIPPRFGTAAIYSIIFLMITISTTLIYIYFTRKTHKFVVVTGKPGQKTLHMLGNWKYVALAICVIIML